VREEKDGKEKGVVEIFVDIDNIVKKL